MKGIFKVVKAPEVIGVSQTTLDQMIEVQFIPSRLPAVAYLGSQTLPRGITKGELGEDLAYFTAADDFYVVSIFRLCDAVQSLHGTSSDLFRWLNKLALEDRAEYLAFDPGIVEEM